MSETANGNGEPPLQSASAGGAEQGAKEPFRYIYLPLASGQIPDEVNLNHYWNALKRRKFRTFIGGSDGPSAYLGSEEEALAYPQFEEVLDGLPRAEGIVDGAVRPIAGMLSVSNGSRRSGAAARRRCGMLSACGIRKFARSTPTNRLGRSS